MNDTPSEKACSKCGIQKSLNDFYYNKAKGRHEHVCKVCWKQRVSHYYKENSAAKLKYAQQYAENNRAKVQSYQRQYRRHNKEKFRLYQERHKSKTLARVRKWKADNKQRYYDSFEASYHKRRALQAAGGSFTIQEWEALCEQYGNVCLACGAPEVTIDHVVPLSKGGSNTIDNLQPLCLTCNDRKGTKIIDYRSYGVHFDMTCAQERTTP